MYDGIINVYKPKGMTSFDVVSAMRRLTGIKKIGHTGTLDPDAEGVLVICIGEALKCVEFMTEKDKEYSAGITFGSSTNTQDASGKILEYSQKRVSVERLNEVLKTFLGKQLQKPPVYSAIKINGKKYCDLARTGKIKDGGPRERQIEIYSINMAETELNSNGEVERAVIDISCSKGTYIRTICNDIGERCGTKAHMSELLRKKSGVFSFEEAYTIESLKSLKDDGKLETAVEPFDKAYYNCRKENFSDENIKRITNGIPIKLYMVYNKKNEYEIGEYIRIYDQKERFRAVGIVKEDEKGKILKGYRIFGIQEKI